VFPSAVGTPQSQHNVRRTWRTILRAASVDETVRIHDLRHTFVSRLIESGADPRTAADLAGHADPRMTLSVYTHTRAEKRKEALLRAASPMDALLDRPRASPTQEAEPDAEAS
jgi:integrase